MDVVSYGGSSSSSRSKNRKLLFAVSEKVRLKRIISDNDYALRETVFTCFLEFSSFDRIKGLIRRKLVFSYCNEIL
jgi:hypothetical protein